MKIYHYTHLKDWRGITKGSWKSADKPGLGASRRVGKLEEESFKTTAVFGLLKPEPENWTANPHFKVTWDYLKIDMGKILLEIEVNPKEDPAFVIDRGHVEGFLYKDIDGIVIPKEYQHKTQKEAEGSYIKSKIKLDNYLKQEQSLGYSLPEVILTADVSLEKIKISEQQPLLEEYLAHFKEGKRESLAWYMKEQFGEISELKKWYETYEDIEQGRKTEVKREQKIRLR